MELDAALSSSINIYKPPVPRKLSEIRRHTLYHEHVARLAAFDAAADATTDASAGVSAKAIRCREQTRFISCSLPIAGCWKQSREAVPSGLFLITLQFSCGLYLSDMYHANVALAAAGLKADWLGDDSSSVPAAAGERSTRHHGLNAAWCDAVRDGLSVPVTRCEKGPRDRPDVRSAASAAYADLNDGHIPDWGVRGAAKDGRHLVGETKCYDCLVPHSSGAGSRGGTAMMGATRPLGNTEESLIKANYGLAERGVGGSGAFNHATGEGHVAEHKGVYYDCIHVKRNTLLLLVSEIFGGVNGRGIRWLTRLAHRSRECSDAAYFSPPCSDSCAARMSMGAWTPLLEE